MRSHHSMNSQTHDARNPRHGRDQNSGRVDKSQVEAQSPRHERGDERRGAGGPGKADKPAT